MSSGAGLVDPLLDVVLGQLERLLGPGPVGHGGGEGPPGDLDLDRDLLADPVQVGTLAVQLGQRGIELGPRDVDLVAVRDRVDLRHDLPLHDAVVLFDQEADDPAGDQLRGDVDDVGLDEGVVGDRMVAAVLDPADRGGQTDGDRDDRQRQSDEAAGAEPDATSLGMGRRGCRPGSRLAGRWGLDRLDRAHGSLHWDRTCPG